MAKMIWVKKGAADKNAYAVFRKEFTLNNASRDTYINICVDSEYALFINDRFVNCGQYDDFPFLKYYDTLKVDEYLKEGCNVLTIYVYYQGESSFQYSCGKAGLWFELVADTVICESDENTLSYADNRYTQGEIYKTTSQYGYGFLFDARKNNLPYEMSDAFDAPQMRQRPIEKCILTEYKIDKIITQGIVQHREQGSMTPAQFMQTDALSHRNYDEIFDDKSVKCENVYIVYDMQCERAGYLSFELDAFEGCIIDIGYGEHLDDMRVRTSIGARNFANRYICCEGKQHFFYPYRRIAGRYIEVHVIGRVRSIDHISLWLCDYPVSDKTHFSSYDVFWTRLHEISFDTLKLCMHEHYEDSPWREQALYGSDSRNQMLFGYYAFHEFKVARASLDLLGQTVGKDGLISMCAPTDCSLKIPSFSFLWLLAMKEYAQYSGDLTLAEEYRDRFIEMAETLAPKNQNDIADSPCGEGIWNFYEWSEGSYDSSSGMNVPKQCDGLYQVFLYIGLSSIQELFKMLLDNQMSEKIGFVLEKMKHAINEKFWDTEKQMYFSYIEDGRKEHYCELMQVMALYSGIGLEKEERILELITSQNELVDITLSYSVYKYDVLMAHGFQYVDYIYNDIVKKWGKMLFDGATSFWETQEGADDFDNAGSLCHGWSAIPLYIMERYVCGITPEMISGQTKEKRGNNLFYPYITVK